jgi:radical SAM protein with 4Fe4S-binding SPASM domain
VVIPFIWEATLALLRTIRRKVACLLQQVPLLRVFWSFDEAHYLASYPDVAAAIDAGAVRSGHDHFVRYGVRENRHHRLRLSLPWFRIFHKFDEAYYLASNPDVIAAIHASKFRNGRNHFDTHGMYEGRHHRFHLRFAFEIVRPESDHLSGIALEHFGSPDHRTLTIKIKPISFWRRSNSRATSIRIDQLEPGLPFPVYWTPIRRSAGERFLITIHDEGKTSRFGARMASSGLIYSKPVASTELPPRILVSPVAQCNLNCIHCISAHSRLRFAKLSDQMWAEIAEGAASGQISFIRSDYSGDIIFDHVRHGGWLDRIIALDVDYAVDTHGNNLTEEIARKLLKSRLREINFSVDSLDPEDYPRIRRGAKPIGEVLDTIRMFMNLRNQIRLDVKVTLSYVLMKRNLGAVAAALDFAAETGIVFHGVHLHAWTPEMVEESLLPDRERYTREFARLSAVAERAGVELGMPEPVGDLAPRRAHKPCQMPWQSVTVLGNGDVMACCVPGTKVGSLHTSSLREVWNGSEMRSFRSRVNSDDPPEPCQTCPMMRVTNNYASYAPCLSGDALAEFERRCAASSAVTR